MISKIFFDITNYCNANCIYCFTDSQKLNGSFFGDELSYTDVEKLIEDLYQLKIKNLSIGGGEPFLKNMTKVFEYSKDKVNISITTNGTIMNQKIIDSIIRNNIKITVSIDSLDRDISNTIRRGINLDTLKENLKYLLKYNDDIEKISVRVTISRYNLDSLMDIVIFCEENNIKHLKMNTTNLFGRAKYCTDIIPEFSKFIDKIDEIKNFCTSNNLKTNVKIPVEKYLSEVERKCSLGKKSVYINARGDVFPCAFTEGELCWGNIKEEELARILDKAEVFSHQNNTCLNCPINRYKPYKARTS